MKNTRLTYYILLFASALTLFSGCSSEDNQVQYRSAVTEQTSVQQEDTRFHTDMIGGQDYAAGSHMEILEANPLALTTVVSTDGSAESYENSYYVYQQLDGLSDLPVQKTINKHIQDSVVAWCKDRPVPDADVYASASQEAKDSAYYGASTSFLFNYCDYLSGIINCTIDYYDPQTAEHSRFTHIIPMNFDLRSGEQFTLAALFVQDYDYKAAIASGAMSYCKANGLNPSDLSDIADHADFCLSVDGLVIYPDASFEDQGIPQSTRITIPFSHFGGSWAISRSCSSIYTEENSGGYILLANASENMVTESTDSYAITGEDGSVTPRDRLSVVITHTYPDDFPSGLFDKADAFAATYAPSTKLRESIEKNQDVYVYQSFSSVGSRVGALCCVTLNASIRQSGEIDTTVLRHYVYDKSGQSVELSSCFAQDYDINDVVSGKMAITLNGLMDAGWTIESEIDLASIDFMPDTDAMSFTTGPIRRSRVITAADGTQTEEIVCESLTVTITYEEIGMENLTIFDLK